MIIFGFFKFKQKNMFLLNINEIETLTNYLTSKNCLQVNEQIVSLTKPGEGNMNCVLRIKTNYRTLIIKQSRAYVEKYPQVAAPANRVLVEAAFLEKISKIDVLQKMMPAILKLYPQDNLMILSDLGESKDFSYLYQSKQILTKEDLLPIIDYLNILNQSFENEELELIFENREMKKLNHEHIFEYPFMIDNGFDLDNIQHGLQEVALVYKNNIELKNKIAEYGKIYLSNGKHLLHGDFYPGSWLKTNNGIKIIDPEFCFLGNREFDLAVLIAHLYLSNQDEHLVTFTKNNYQAYKDLDENLLKAFVGIEIMRRTIGLAQLSLEMSLENKSKLLLFAKSLIN